MGVFLISSFSSFLSRIRRTTDGAFVLSSYPHAILIIIFASHYHFSRASAQCSCSRHYRCLVHFLQCLGLSCGVPLSVLCSATFLWYLTAHSPRSYAYFPIHYSLLHISKATVTHMASALVSLSALWFVCSLIYRAQKVLVHRCDSTVSYVYKFLPMYIYHPYQVLRAFAFAAK